MIKKIDKFVFQAFFGPFFLTLAIVLFILLTQFIMKNFPHFVGKDLGADVFAALFFYFTLVMTPVALPLAVLLASLMCFGTLGEHSELTAIKSAGISLVRILLPIGGFVIVLTVAGYFFNDYVVTHANLKAYSLLYDIKQKKAALEFKDGIFYNGLPGYSIKVDRQDKKTSRLYGVMIYDHSDHRGNTSVIMAEEGAMYTFDNNKFLGLDLYNGSNYAEVSAQNGTLGRVEYVRNAFDSSKIVFSLASFGLSITEEDLFKEHNIMKTRSQLEEELDSVAKFVRKAGSMMPTIIKDQFYYGRPPQPAAQMVVESHPEETITRDSATGMRVSQGVVHKSKKLRVPHTPMLPDSLLAKTEPKGHQEKLVAINPDNRYAIYNQAVSQATNIKNMVESNLMQNTENDKRITAYHVDLQTKFALPFSIFVMFLIGAPLGAIIKKGGLGVPVLASIVFFLIHYIISMTGKKYASEEVIPVWLGIWVSNIVLFMVGLFFLRQARNDARLFDTDFYAVAFDKIRQFVNSRKAKNTVA